MLAGKLADTPQAENLPTESFSSHTQPHPAGAGLCLQLTSNSKAVPVSASEKHRPLAQELVLCPSASREVDGTHAVSRPTWSLGGWGGQGQVWEHSCQLIVWQQ